MLSLDTLHALPVHALNDLIAVHAEGWRPLTAQEQLFPDLFRGYTHRAPDGGLRTVPDYTGDWNLTMGLACQYKIDLRYDVLDGAGITGWMIEYYPALRFVADDRENEAPCLVEAQLRRDLCELVLYVAMAMQQARSPHKDGTAGMPSTAGYSQHHPAPTGTLPDAFYEALRTFEAPAPDCHICHHTAPASALCSRCGPACTPCQQVEL